jgi:hypothetical protein
MTTSFGARAGVDVEPSGEALEHFKKAVGLTQKGKTRDALDEFQAAYDLSPSWRILYNIGLLARAEHDDLRSFLAFRKYLADGGADVPKPRRTEVEQALSELRPRVGSLEVRVSREGAAVTIDDVVVGVTPLPEPVFLRPGKHRVTVAHRGLGVERTVDIAAGAQATVELVLTPRSAPSVQPTSAPTVEQRASTLPKKVAFGIAGTLGIAGLVTGVTAIAMSKGLSNQAYVDANQAATLRSRGSTVNGLATATDLLLIGAAVSGSVGLVLMLREGAGPPKAELSVSASGVTLRGGF